MTQSATEMINTAIQIVRAGQENEGYRLIVAALEAEPDNASGLYHLGLGLQAAKSYPAAAVAFKRALALAPGTSSDQDLAIMELNAGYMLHLAGRTREALPLLESATRRAPQWALAWLDLSQIYTTLDRMDEGLKCAQKAVDLAPEEPRAQMSLAFALCFKGRWAEGFAAYEARFRFKIPELLSYPFPRWDGRNVDTLFIQAEQGLGDTIMMMRYLTKACERAKRVILYVQREVKTLVEMHVPKHCEVHGMPKPVPAAADAFVPMMSLPLAMGMLSDISRRNPYIGAPIDWDRDTDKRSTALGPQIGIVWSGDPAHDLDRWRSIPLEQLNPLFEMQGVRWHSLQVGPRAQDLGTGYYGLIKDQSPNITNMADTARIIATELDAVVTVDTATAHLAGAMNKPVYVLVNQQGNDWRWMPPSRTTPWYPSMRLFRKPLDEATWHSAIIELRRALRGLDV